MIMHVPLYKGKGGKNERNEYRQYREKIKDLFGTFIELQRRTTERTEYRVRRCWKSKKWRRICWII